MAGSLTDEQTDAIAADLTEFTDDLAQTLTRCAAAIEQMLMTRDDPDARHALADLTTYQREIPRIRNGLSWFQTAPTGGDGSPEAMQFGRAFDWIMETLEKGVALRDRVAAFGEPALAA